jgi:hypothetical protein
MEKWIGKQQSRILKKAKETSRRVIGKTARWPGMRWRLELNIILILEVTGTYD